MQHSNHVAASQAFGRQRWPDVLRLLPQAEIRHHDDARMHAIALSELGQPAAARVLLEPFIAAEPRNPVLRVNLASILRRLGAIDAAKAELGVALDLAPQYPPALLNLGNLLRLDARLAEAAPIYRQFLAAQPLHVEARIAVAEIDKALGHIDESIEHFREAIRIKPTAGAAWWGIANLKTRPLTRDDLHQLDELWQAPGLNPKDRDPLGFARASAHARFSDPRLAWQVLGEANAQVAAQRPFRADTFEQTVADQMARLAPAPASTNLPGQEVIFIVGLPRSGSTLLEQMLAAHPAISAASELPDFPALVQTTRGTPMDPTDLGRQYLQRTERWRQDHPRHIDKWPGNFLHLADILQALPGARVIECRRDARDNALSCLQQYFSLGNTFSFDLDAIAQYGRGCRTLMDRAVAVAPNQVMVVHYEELVANPEQSIRQVLEFSGLMWSQECLHPERVARTVRTASAAQVREPMDQRGIGRYRQFGFAFESWDSNGKL